MVALIPMWQVYCDGCGCSTPTDEVGAWGTAADALTHADNCDWLTVGEKHYCLDCIEEEAGTFRPKSREAIIFTYRTRVVRLLRDEASERHDSMWDDFASFIENLPKRLY